MARVSFSQYSMWHSCPHQYKLSYIEGLSESSSNIHSIFGTAMHETLQNYLEKCLRISKSQADKMIDLKEYLKERMRDAYLKETGGEIGNTTICTKEEMVEFVENMQQADLEKMQKFFDTMPKFKKMVHFKCPKCKYEEDMVIEGIQNFFV